MGDETKKEGECCGTSSGGSGGGCCCCGGGKKLIVGLLAGVLLAAAAFGFFSAGKCLGGGKFCPLMKDGKICPVSGMTMPQAPAQP